MRSFILSLILFAVAAAPVAAGISDAEWKEKMQAFKDDFRKKSIKFKQRAVEILPLNDERTIKFIIEKKKLLADKNWWIRGTAAERLGKIKNPALRKKMLAYAKNSDKRIREGIMCATAMNGDRLDAPFILEALKDPAWEVRRMAVWAAGRQRIPEAVDQMISMIADTDGRSGQVIQEGESNPRVHSVLLFNLEEITGKYFHTDSRAWKDYWDRNKDRTLPKVKRFDVHTYADLKMQVNDTFARKGSGPLVLVLPTTHKTTVYYMPYFNQWMFVKWFFVNLPPIRSFPDVKLNRMGDPIYPVDQLVVAFEDIRKKNGVEKMVILAHGFTNWVAAKYAQKFPDRVSGLIMLNPYASNDAFSKAIDRAKRSGDPDAEFWGKVSSYEIKAASAREQAIYNYYRDTAALAKKNRSDMEITLLRSMWREPEGSSIGIEEFDIRGEETSRVPALMFFAPKSNELTGIGGMNRLNRYYPKHVTVKLGSKAARLPFMEAPETFEKALRMFLDKYVIK